MNASLGAELAELGHRAITSRDLDLLAAGMLIDDPTDGPVDAADGPETVGLAVVFIDIDGFKQVNETLGLMAGDLVLVEATARLQTRARPEDVLARLGGDAFVVLCKRGGPAAPVIAERLLSAFDEPFDIEGQDMFLSASAGISIAAAGITSKQLLADADIAMYRAKKIAGSATVAFHPDMRAEAAAEGRLHNELRRARLRGELRAVYQPIVDLSTGHIHGVEALLRWRHPELGDVPADIAVAAAERIGIAWDLTSWIAQESATVVQAWNAANPGHTPLRLAVHLAPLLLDDPARGCELEPIAEGIETEAQLAAAIAAGFDFGPGSLFSRPLETHQLPGLAPDESRFAELVRGGHDVNGSSRQTPARTATSSRNRAQA